jgi:hypothetical protein
LYSKIFTDNLILKYPESKNLANEILDMVDKVVIKETLIIDNERSFLQKRCGLKTKLQSIENTIHRLNQEIIEIKNQELNSNLWYSIRDENLKKLKIKVNENVHQLLKSKYINSLKKNLELEVLQYREFDIQLKNLKKRKL